MYVVDVPAVSPSPSAPISSSLPPPESPSQASSEGISTLPPFPSEEKAPEPCSYVECWRGHRWDPQIRNTQCPGCRSAILALRMSNCPVCNEPSEKLRLRVEHLPTGGTITPLCRGAGTLNEVIEVRLEHAHAEESSHIAREVLSKPA